MNPNDPLGLGNFNTQALHPDEESMNSGKLPSRPAHAGPSGIEGWFARNAPTIGGTIGAIATSPLEALDAVSGVGGTALNVAGAGFGAGIGQEIKNKLDPSQSTNPIKEGVIGGATQLGGDVVGKLLSPIAKRGASLLHNYGTDILSQVGGTLDRKTARALDARGTTDIMNQLGVDPKDFGDVASKVTGSDGIVNKIVQRGIGQAGKVDTTGIKDMTDALAGQDTRFDNENVQKKATDFVKSGIDKLNGVEDTNASPLLTRTRYDADGNPIPTNSLTRDVTNKGADPSDTLQFSRTLRSKASELVGKGKNPLTVSDTSRAVANLYNHVADELEERLYTDGTTSAGVKGAGADKVVTNGLIKDSDLQSLKDASPGNKKWASLIDQVKGANSIGELRTLQRPFVNASKIATEKALSKAGEGASKSNLIKGGVGVGALLAAPASHGTSLLIPAAETDTGKGVISKGLQLGSKTLGKTVTNNEPGKVTIKDVINKGLLQAGSHTAGSIYQKPTTPDGVAQATGNGPVSSVVADQVNQLTDAVTKQTTQQPPIQMLTPAQAQSIINSSGEEGLREVTDYLNTNLSIQKQEYPELTQDQQTQILDTTKALQGVTSLAQLYDQTVAMGAGTGTLAEIGTHIPGIQNTAAESALRTYNDNRGDLAATIANVLGSGRSSAAMINQIKAELPTPTDSPQAAQQKFALVLSRLQSAMSGTLAAPATNTPGQLTNFANQTIPGLNTSLSGSSDNLGLLNFLGAGNNSAPVTQ